MRIADEVVARAISVGRSQWGERLIAAYAIGSLAHGGFSEHASDIDVALIIAPPLQVDDAGRAEAAKRDVAASGLPLAERLSLFWSSLERPSPEGQSGRLPAPDLLDLRRHGRLLHGVDVREHLPVPTYRELLVSSAAFALRRLADEAGIGYLRDPVLLLEGKSIAATKFVLYPVRLLFTAQTGEVGANADAVAHFARIAPEATRALAVAALEWRDEPAKLADPSAAAMIRAGLRPLYRLFVEDYVQRLHKHDAPGLAQRFREWSRAIAPSG
jgi:predicted nucleotidyltransferase